LLDPSLLSAHSGTKKAAANTKIPYGKSKNPEEEGVAISNIKHIGVLVAHQSIVKRAEFP
jgi:hypothetical protein